MSTTCAECGVTICLGTGQLHSLRATGETFFCPSGHRNYFPDGCEHQQELKEEIERLRTMVWRVSNMADEFYAETKQCPWPGCRDRYTYATRGTMYAHMRRVHDMPALAEVHVEQSA